MIMRNEEQIFDFMAAAEETGRQLDEMVRRLPGELKAVLAEEWRKSSWLAELPMAAKKAMAATTQTEVATRYLARNVKFAGFIVCLASVIIPLATWGVAYWNVSALRREQIFLKQENGELAAAIEATVKVARDDISRREDEIKKLTDTMEALKAGVGGGIELVDRGGGAWSLMLPAYITFEEMWREPDGRYVIPYIVSRK
jgi:hypothetical protein